MILRDIHHSGLAQVSYLVGCSAAGEALIVDPNRDIQQYIDLAEHEGLKITKIVETHIHADYVSGARELARATGATPYLSKEGGDDWQYEFAREIGAVLIDGGDTVMLGNIKLDVLHTPGHTPEHVSFLVTDTAGADKPMGIFTGDFIFVGDVGRPDLLEKAAGFADTMEHGARQLYQSLQQIKELPDYVQIWPGHGAGSACGKALGAVPQTTVGYERLFSWAFQAKSEDEFVETVLEDQPEPPVYFKQMKHVNKYGPTLMHGLDSPVKKMFADLQAAMSSQQPVVDVRPKEKFAAGYIPGTINIPWEKSFVTWSGWLLPYDQPFHAIVDPEMIDEITHELRMIGLDTLEYYWSTDIIDEWASAGNELGTIEQVTVDEIDNIGSHQIIDVRSASEYVDGHAPGSQHVPVGYVGDELSEISEDRPLVFMCGSGHRSSIAASVAAARGRTDIYNLVGGFSAWEEADREIETSRETASTPS